MGTSLIGKLIRDLFALITLLMFNLVTLIYNLLYDIANTSIFSDTMNTLGKNIYSILGVIMLFKLAFSIISYIVNPDAMSNKDSGFGALIKNVFIVMALILLVPIVFDQSIKLQQIILQEDILGRVITGVNKSSGDQISKSAGQQMSFNLLSGFLRPNKDVFEECENVLNKDSISYEECKTAISGEDGYAIYNTAMENNSISDLLKLDLINATTTKGDDGEQFVFDFDFLVAPIVGGFVAYILLLFCIDVALRSVKLTFLQIISPIPIVSYIDPKGQKGMFNKWVKNCTSTYLDLFIRLAAIYFVVYIIQNVLLNGTLRTAAGVDANGVIIYKDANIFVIIFMILGSLLFAKQLPNLISDLTGVKMDGKFTLNPMKKVSEVPVVGNKLSQGIGFAGRTTKNLGLATGALIGTGIGYGASKLGDAVKGSSVGQFTSSKINNLKNSSFAQDFSRKRANISNAMSDFGDAVMSSPSGKYLGRIGADAQGLMGGLTKSSGDKKLNAYKNVTDSIANLESRAKEKIKNGEAGALSASYLEKSSEINRLKNMTAEQVTMFNKANPTFSYDQYLAKKEMEFNEWFNNDAMYEYIDNNGKDTERAKEIFGVKDGHAKSDATLTGFANDYSQAVSSGGFERKTSAKDMHGQMGEFKGAQNDIKRQRMAINEAQKK